MFEAAVRLITGASELRGCGAGRIVVVMVRPGGVDAGMGDGVVEVGEHVMLGGESVECANRT